MNCHRFLHETQFYCLILRICYPCEIIIKEVLHVDFTLKKEKKKKVLEAAKQGTEDIYQIVWDGHHHRSIWSHSEQAHLWRRQTLGGAGCSLWQRSHPSLSTQQKKKKPNKEDVYMLVKKNKKQTKVGNGFLFLMSKIQMESQIWTRKSS